MADHSPPLPRASMPSPKQYKSTPPPLQWQTPSNPAQPPAAPGAPAPLPAPVTSRESRTPFEQPQNAGSSSMARQLPAAGSVPTTPQPFDVNLGARKPRNFASDDDKLIMLRHCNAHREEYANSTLTEFWGKIRKLLHDETGMAHYPSAKSIGQLQVLDSPGSDSPSIERNWPLLSCPLFAKLHLAKDLSLMLPSPHRY